MRLQQHQESLEALSQVRDEADFYLLLPSNVVSNTVLIVSGVVISEVTAKPSSGVGVTNDMSVSVV